MFGACYTFIQYNSSSTPIVAIPRVTHFSVPCPQQLPSILQDAETECLPWTFHSTERAGLLKEAELTELLPPSFILQGATAANTLYTPLCSRNSPVLHLVWPPSQARKGERKRPGSLQVDHSVIYDYIA